MLNVSDSVFLKNKTGVSASTSRPVVKNTAFLKNDTAISLTVENPESNDWACADLTKVSFVANKKNLVGPRCAVN